MKEKELLEWLIDLFKKSSLSELKFETSEFKIVLKKFQEDSTYPKVDIEKQAEDAKTQSTIHSEEKVSQPSNNTFHLKSPMVGTFYITPAPDKPPFVNEGDIIKKGQTVCIIEAMKLFNEIQYEEDKPAKVEKILVNNGTPVQYDQPLFLLSYVE